jgi:hypothetical protein
MGLYCGIDLHSVDRLKLGVPSAPHCCFLAPPTSVAQEDPPLIKGCYQGSVELDLTARWSHRNAKLQTELTGSAPRCGDGLVRRGRLIRRS